MDTYFAYAANRAAESRSTVETLRSEWLTPQLRKLAREVTARMVSSTAPQSRQGECVARIARAEREIRDALEAASSAFSDLSELMSEAGKMARRVS